MPSERSLTEYQQELQAMIDDLKISDVDPMAFINVETIINVDARMLFMRAQLLQWQILRDNMTEQLRQWGEMFSELQKRGVKEIQIFVGSVGRTIILDVNIHNTIKELKAMLEEMDGIPPDQQRLIYAGKQLEDAMTVSAYNIPMNATLTMTMNLKGGVRTFTGTRRAGSTIKKRSTINADLAAMVKVAAPPIQGVVEQTAAHVKEVMELMSAGQKVLHGLLMKLTLQEQHDVEKLFSQKSGGETERRLIEFTGMLFKTYNSLEQVRMQAEEYTEILKQLTMSMFANLYLEETSGRYNVERFKEDLKEIMLETAKNGVM